MKWLISLLCMLLLVAPVFSKTSGESPTRTASYNLDPNKSVTYSIAYDQYQTTDLKTLAYTQVSQKSSPVILDIEVYDSNGNEVSDAVGNGSYLAAYWKPASNQVYKIVITNLSNTTSTAIDITFG